MVRQRSLALTLCLLAATAFSTAALAQTVPSDARAGSWEGFMEDRNFDQFITLTLPTRSDGEGALQVLGRSIPVTEVVWSGDRVTARVGRAEDNLRIEARRQDGELAGQLAQGASIQAFLLRRIPDYPAPRNRAEAWGQDLDALAQRYAALNRSFSNAERALFLERLEAIRSQLGHLTDDQISLQIASALALDEEPHTRLLLLRNATALRRLPIRVWWFPDGLRIVRTTSEYRHLLGCRIEDFANVPARQARDLAGRAYAGNPSWRDYMTTYTLTSPEALHGLGVIETNEDVELGVSDCRARGRQTIRPMPLARSDRTVESWWDLSPLRESPHGITAHVLGEDARRLPPYLRKVNENYAFEYLEDSGVLYLQLNRSQPSAQEAPRAFADRLVGEIERRRPRAIVLDLRFNTGGDSGVSRELLRRVNEATTTIPRFVITGRATFSAGISAVAQFLSGGAATIVGEPAGDDLEHWSEGGYILLPNSRLEADFQTVLHSYSPAPCPEATSCVDMSVDRLAPDLPVTASWEDYRSRRDPALEVIVRSLSR